MRIWFLSVLSGKQKTRHNQEGRNWHSKSSPSNDSKFSRALVIFPNCVYICRNERAQEVPDSGVFISFHPLILARLGIFKNTNASRCTTNAVGLHLPGCHGELAAKLVWGTQTLRSVSRKAVEKGHMEGSHNVTSQFSLYHASLLYSYKSKEVLSVTSPGS